MHGELVFTTTSDFVRLHGLYRRSDQNPATTPEKGSVDAAVLIHGLGGNFYSSRLLLHFSEKLMELGISVVIVNTRGHDMINTTTWSGRARSVGAALENVGDSVCDLAAWADFLGDRGHANVLLFGHSLGAIKSLYAQAHQPHPLVRSIIGLSATRLSYERLIDAPNGKLFRETIERCQLLIEQDQADTPIHVACPFPTWMTPRCYLDKYGPAETYDWIRFVDKINVPTLLFFGQKELDNNPAFNGLRDDLEKLKDGWNPISVEEIQGADHFYTSRFQPVDELIVSWLTR